MSDALKLAEQYFGFTSLLPGQKKVIDTLMQGRSAAAIFPTGGGKSLCYQLPALSFEGLTLVVSPLLALMRDQIDALKARGILAHRLDSTLTLEEYRQVMQDIRSNKARILYVAPERFNNERFKGSLEGVRISLFAIDEAHCISEWGHNFRPDYLKLQRLAKDFKAERVLALTATATPKVVRDISKVFNIADDDVTRTPFYRSNLEVHLTPVRARERMNHLLKRLRERAKGPTLVYVSLQKTAEQVAARLRDEGFDAHAYHAGLKSDERGRVQDMFLSSTNAIVVATIAFGMGVDKSDIRQVLHYNLPKSLENMAQEIGRAGRDGKPSFCEVLVCADDLAQLENFTYGDTPSKGGIMRMLKALFESDAHADPTRQEKGALALDLYSLSRETDIRTLVLRTLLTWLELEGVLTSGTPMYAGFRFKPLKSGAEILSLVDGERRDFLAAIFKQGKRKKTWVDIDVDRCAEITQSPRERVVRALDWLAEQNHLELKPQGVRHRYRFLERPQSLEALADDLYARMQTREEKEIKRLKAVLRLCEAKTCQVRGLGAYFGDSDQTPCGHCSYCARGAVEVFKRAPYEGDLSSACRRTQEISRDFSPALDEPRQQARFLTGLNSPALSKHKLSKHELFGALEGAPFANVLLALSST